MSTLTLSRVMMPWDWIGIVTIRSDTFISRSMTGMITASPGSLTPTTLPRRNNTPFSYWVTTLIDSANTISAIKTSTATRMIKPFMACPSSMSRNLAFGPRSHTKPLLGVS